MSNLYHNKWIGYGYDLLASLVWLPSKNKLYDQSVSLLGIQPNETVLELGCGTGFLTRKLLNQKAIVTSVDQSEGMLARARQRASGATFVQSDILQYTDARRYDCVVLFFVMHELGATQRISLLQSAKEFLTEDGEIIICDFAIPDKGILRTLFPKLISLWEPDSTLEVLKNGFEAEILSNRLAITSHTKLYHGRVQMIRLRDSLSVNR